MIIKPTVRQVRPLRLAWPSRPRWQVCVTHEYDGEYDCVVTYWHTWREAYNWAYFTAKEWSE